MSFFSITYKMITLLMFMASFAFAENNQFDLNFREGNGKIYGFKALPKVAFFTGPIAFGDTLSLRKTLRNHDIEVIVLTSDGGVVFEGLLMAGIIHDKGITTYIPAVRFVSENDIVAGESSPPAHCVSACSFMFFAGRNRLAKGLLGVHQVRSKNGTTVDITGTEFEIQYTTSEIIGYLNEFGTPPFVYERMFQDTEMYYFSKPEIAQLNSTEKLPIHISLEEIEKFIKSHNDTITEGYKEVQLIVTDTTEPVQDRETILKLVQSELNRIGCEAGPVDGKLGDKTLTGFKRFIELSNITISIEKIFYKNFIDALKRTPAGFCPPLPKSKTKQLWGGWKPVLAGTWDLEIDCQTNGKYRGTFFLQALKAQSVNEGDYSIRYEVNIDGENRVYTGILHQKGNLISAAASGKSGQVSATATVSNNYKTAKGTDNIGCKLTSTKR
jgi:hypothetical protein